MNDMNREIGEGVYINASSFLSQSADGQDGSLEQNEERNGFIEKLKVWWSLFLEGENGRNGRSVSLFSQTEEPKVIGYEQVDRERRATAEKIKEAERKGWF
jgi:hypothetical protein